MGQFDFEDVVGVADLFRREPNPNTDSLTPYLLNEAGEDKGICPDFLAEVISRFNEDDTVKPMLTKAVAGLSLQLSNLTMNDNYKPYINVSSENLRPSLGTADTEDILGLFQDWSGVINLLHRGKLCLHICKLPALFEKLSLTSL